jgi:hypothetical protein
VREASIAANQIALSEFTGSPVIAVFHTLSAGKAGQFVPGMVVPGTRSDGRLVAEALSGTTPSTATIAPRTTKNLCRGANRRRR